MELKHENIFKYLLVCFIVSIVGLTATFIKMEQARNVPPATTTIADSVTADISDTARAPSSQNQ